MGYYTRVIGEFRIEPPILWADVKGSPFLDQDSDYEALLRVEETAEELPEGTLVRREAVAIVPWSDDRYKAYNLIEHVQKIVDTFGAGRTFTGRFDCEGEENGDLWRLEIHGGKAVAVKPRIVWPDGSETRPR
jgi:hypothetical protein